MAELGFAKIKFQLLSPSTSSDKNSLCMYSIVVWIVKYNYVIIWMLLI